MTFSRRLFFPATVLPVAFTLATSAPVHGQTSPAGPSSAEKPPTSERVRGVLAPYAAMGSSLAQSKRLHELGWNEAQLSAFIEGIRASYRGEDYPLDDTAKKLVAEMIERVAAIDAERKQREFARPEKLESYMKEICAKYHLRRSDTGLGFSVVEGAKGIRPSPDDRIVFTMAATADDVATRLPQLSFEKMRARVSDLMPGLAEGIQTMTIGGKAMFVLPPPLSFGEGPWPPGVVRGTPLVLFVTLIEVIPEAVEP